jgi:aryl-alcohol dehydrogenase-like predicted oxidoreductase
VVKAALDEGVNLIDTAAVYGTEPIVGAAVRNCRDRVFLSTKGIVYAAGTSPNCTEHLIDGHELRRRLEASLSALQTDYLDLFHLHGITPGQYPHCREVLVPALEDFRAEGLIRFTCITERFLTDQRHAMLAAALADDFWDVVMCGFNYINQTAASTILPEAERRDVGTLCMYAVRGPLGDPSRARGMVEKLVASGEVEAAAVDADDPLGFLTADGVAHSLADAAYRFCAHTPGIDVVVTGTGSIDHLRENVRSINAPPLPANVVERLRSMFVNAWSETGEAGG